MVIAARKIRRLQKAAKALEDASGQRCMAVQLDVRDAPAVTRAVRDAVKEFGRLDILVNAAAGNFLCPAGSLSTNAFRTVMGEFCVQLRARAALQAEICLLASHRIGSTADQLAVRNRHNWHLHNLQGRLRRVRRYGARGSVSTPKHESPPTLPPSHASSHCEGTCGIMVVRFSTSLQRWA